MNHYLRNGQLRDSNINSKHRSCLEGKNEQESSRNILSNRLDVQVCYKTSLVKNSANITYNMQKLNENWIFKSTDSLQNQGFPES